MKKLLLISLAVSNIVFNMTPLVAQIPPIILQQGSPSIETTNSIALSSDNSIIISGIIDSSITIGNNTLNYTGGYISKYDDTGQNLWLIPAGKFKYDKKTPVIAVDNNDDIYVLGIFDDTCHIGNTMLVSTGLNNSFLAKLSSSGMIIWAKILTNNSAVLRDMNVDRFGNILLTGMLVNTLYLDNDTLTPQGYDVVTIKLDNFGNLIWMKKAGGPNSGYSELGFSISSDYYGNVYIAGNIRSINPLFDTIVVPKSTLYGPTGFVAKYDSLGSIIYANRCGYESFSVSSDSSGNTFVCGYYYTTFAFDTIVNWGGSGSPRAFLVSVSPNGNLQWTQLFNADYSNSNAVIADNNGNCFVTGISRDTTKIFGTVDTLILVNDIYPQPGNCQYVIGFNSTGNPFWGNIVKIGNFSINSHDITYKNCQVAFTGDFTSPAQPIYYNNTSIVSLGRTDGFAIIDNTCGIVTDIGINLDSFDEIKCFPNPFKNELIIKLNNSKISEVILYDIYSRNLLQQTFTNSTTINTGQLAKGIYVYEVRNKNGVVGAGKVMKE